MKNNRRMFFIAVISAAIFSLSIITSATEAHARGIGVKMGYGTMMDDYKDKYENGLSYGLFFDMGKFVFDNLNFKPGFNYVKLEDKDGASNRDKDLWGIHLDWYWNFLGKAKFSPFLGFGAALNIYDDNDDTSDGDSDSGVEVFGGVDIGITSTISLGIEARYCFNDIANTDQNIFKILGSVTFFF